MELLIAFLVAVSVTMALIPPLIKLAPRLQFIDLPQERKVHVTPVPRVGGIAMAVGVMLAWFAWGKLGVQMNALIASIGVLLVFGIWDDRATLSAGAKFAGQMISALMVMWWGGIHIDSITFASPYMLPFWIGAPMTFVFLVGATNAINLADGLDGLAGGTTMLCMAGLALLAFSVGNVQVGGAAVLIIGAVLGFLRYNTYPARVFMGDSGSQLLGFSAAVLALMLTQDRNAPLSSALPLLLLGVPIIDTSSVMISRMLAGHSPFKADRNHIHHRLLQLGFHHHEAVIVIYLAQSLFFVSAWLMRYDSDALIVAVFLLLAASILLSLHFAVRKQWRWRRLSGDTVGAPPLNSTRTLRLTDPILVPRWSSRVIALSLACYAVMAIGWTSRLGPDAMVLAAGALAVLLINLAIRWRQAESGWIDKAALYLCAALLVYLDESTLLPHVDSYRFTWVPVVLVALAVAVRLFVHPDRRFVLTPLDVLVVVGAVVVPNLPGSIANPQVLGSAIAKLVVMFYGVETLNVMAGARWRMLSICAVMIFAATALYAL
jgi:UDP-GlcNAc:undecaprenyl-phosphate/decaprenyl-phosphate GlcNAc-1-phosphate transferase